MIVGNVIQEMSGDVDELLLFTGNQARLGMAASGIGGGIEKTGESDGRRRIDGAHDLESGGFGGSAAAAVGGGERVGLVFMDGAGGVGLGVSGDGARAALGDISERRDHDGIGVRGGPRQSGGILLDDFVANSVVADDRFAEGERGGGLDIHIHCDGFRGIAAGTFCGEDIGGSTRGRDGAITVARNFADARDGSIDGVGGFPVKRGGTTATESGILSGELRGDGSDGNRGASDACVETRLGRHVEALFPIFGFRLAIVIEIDDDLLAGFGGDGAGPDGVAFVRDGQLVSAGMDEKTLMPNPAPIEFVDVADEIGGRFAVEKNGSAGITFEFDVGEGPVDNIARGLEMNAEIGAFPGANVDILDLGKEAVIVDPDFVIAGGELNGLAAIPNGFAIDEDIGLLRVDVNFQLARFHGRLSEGWGHAEKYRGGKHENDWTKQSPEHLGDSPC